jgi:energy-coupling factor transporter ATP-binding protein EcfA2
VARMSPLVSLDSAAAGLRTLPPSCGPVRLIAVDGHAGSGKSTFAALLAGALGDAPVLRLDDLATHDELFGWTGRLLDQVIGPLSRGERALYEPYDWHLRRFGASCTLPAAPVVLIEGVGAGRRALRPYLARLLWMDRGPRESWIRGRHRDGPALSGFWDGWTVAETRHFAEDPSRPYADTLVREWPEGYEWLPGPQATAGANHFLTERDQLSPPY